MPRLERQPRLALGFSLRLMSLGVAIGFFALSRAGSAQTTVPEAAPSADATDQAPIIPSAPPGIYITPPTQPMFRPRPPRDQDDGPVEGCPAGNLRKLELLV